MTPVIPVVMRVETAARYCDMSVSTFRKLKIPAVTANERGERMWRRVDIDEYWETRRNVPANGAEPVEVKN